MVAADCLPIGGTGSCRFKGGNTYRATRVHTPGAEVKHMLQAGRLCCHGMDPMNFRTSISFVRPMWTSTKRLMPGAAGPSGPLGPLGKEAKGRTTRTGHVFVPGMGLGRRKQWHFAAAPSRLLALQGPGTGHNEGLAVSIPFISYIVIPFTVLTKCKRAGVGLATRFRPTPKDWTTTFSRLLWD